MELFEKKFNDAAKALETLEQALKADFTVFVRDSAIQRFEYSVEIVWRCLQTFLKEHEGIVSSSPKSCIREAKRNSLLNDDEAELALEMIDDRNLTSHTYHEEIAIMLFDRLPQYYDLMKKILKLVHEKKI
jgi:nucleotidyltransferase substrate binding protein (TIGR01987 family)